MIEGTIDRIIIDRIMVKAALNGVNHLGEQTTLSSMHGVLHFGTIAPTIHTSEELPT